MQTSNFLKLICEITGRPFQLSDVSGLWVQTLDQDIVACKVYHVFRVLPLTGRVVAFKWKAALDEEKLLRSFLTAFCSGYFEPNPASYSDHQPGNRWENWDERKRESAFGHHRGFMFGKDELMRQVEARFKLPEMRAVFMKYGFYYTNYGVGIYCLFSSSSLESAIEQMREFLKSRGVGFSNEFSKAGWVFRFRIDLSREIHAGLLTEFSTVNA